MCLTIYKCQVIRRLARKQYAYFQLLLNLIFLFLLSMLHDKDMMALMNNDDDDFSLIYIYIPIKENFQKIMNEEMLKKCAL